MAFGMVLVVSVSFLAIFVGGMIAGGLSMRDRMRKRVERAEGRAGKAEAESERLRKEFADLDEFVSASLRAGRLR